MRTRVVLVVAAMSLLLAVGGCASSKTLGVQGEVGGAELARPDRIVIYNIAATADGVDAVSGLTYEWRQEPQSPEDIRRGRELGALFARELAKKVEEMGFVAPLAAEGNHPQPGDLVIKGQFLSVNEGSRLKRIVIGFGAGAAKLFTHVEAYYKTEWGLQRMGTANIKAEGGKMPGMAVPIGIGAAAGNAVVSAAVSGGSGALREGGPESIKGAVRRSADQTAKLLSQRFYKRGWIPAEKVRN